MSDGPTGSFPPAATTLLPWRRAAEFTYTLGPDKRVDLEPPTSHLTLRSHAPRQRGVLGEESVNDSQRFNSRLLI